ncbi:hypothetical protein Tco_0327795 [Tanacetum coccineum]
MVSVHSSKRKKRKDREATESWMNTPISFPSIMTDDASDEPLIIEAEVEGYLEEDIETFGKIDLELKGKKRPKKRRAWMLPYGKKWISSKRQKPSQNDKTEHRKGEKTRAKIRPNPKKGQSQSQY